tara:strand:+ start:1212 stop:1814 length:603 start_codon:yes stop_codon:yes gene_type:complete
MTSKIKVDTIEEKTSSNGVSIDGVVLKDNALTSAGATLTDNITFSASGKGIHLGVTSATAANLLDDYEEGTFTPVVSDAESGGNTASIGFKSGVYVKVGNIVTVMVNMFNINKSGMTSSSNVNFQGLPFAVSNDFFSHVTGVCDVDLVDFNAYVTFLAFNNLSRGLFRNIRDNDTDLAITVSNLSAQDSDINFTITYKTA